MPIDMNKTIEQASLNNLHDIVVPDAIGFFPLAEGWYVVLLLVLTMAFHFAVKRYMAYKRELYRREAMLELDSYDEQNKEDVLNLLSLAKRVAINAYGREIVAKLSDNKWWDFVEENSDILVDNKLRNDISNLIYCDDCEITFAPYEEIENMVREWITTHKVSTNV